MTASLSQSSQFILWTETNEGLSLFRTFSQNYNEDKIAIYPSHEHVVAMATTPGQL